MSIRPYVLTDKDRLLSLYTLFGEYLAAVDPERLNKVESGYAEYFYNEALAYADNKDGSILVAEDDGLVIGFVVGYTVYVPEDNVESNPHKKGIVLDLYIEERYRGKGIGSELMKAMRTFFKENGCQYMHVEVFAPNRSAYEFYKRQGFTERNYDLMMKLD